MKHAESRQRNIEIVAARKAGESIASLVTRYGLHRSYVSRIVKGTPRTALRPSRPPTPREARMAVMYVDGMTLQQIGTEFRVSRERVRQILVKRFGITRKDGGSTIRRFKRSHDIVSAMKKAEERRERRCLTKWGMTLDQFRSHVAEWGSSSNSASPMHKFIQHRTNAVRRRGIEWNITFAEWWRIWRESGRWAERGRGKGYCMARYGDSGLYAPDNVYICTIGQNFSDSYIVKPWKDRFRNRYPASGPHNHSGGKGWTFVARQTKRPYQVTFRRKYLGSFATAEEAHSAYLQARAAA